MCLYTFDQGDDTVLVEAKGIPVAEEMTKGEI